MDRHDEGFRITRRSALHGGIAAGAFFALSSSLRARAAATAGHGGDYTGFLSDWTARAHELVEAGGPNEEAFVHELCGALATLDRGTLPARKRIAFDGMGMKTGPVGGDAVFQLLEIEVEPGRVIPAHNHVGFAFVTLGIKGEALARHFEPVGEGADPGREHGIDFTVREVSSALIRPGVTSTLTRTRANIHTFVAGDEGVTLLDLGVHLPDPGDGPESFSVLDIDARARDPEWRTYSARWIGNIYAK